MMNQPVNRRAKEGETETVSKPKIVTDYNQYMSGVDIADQLMMCYAFGRRTLKWYKRVFWRLLKHAINSFILFKQVIQPNLRLWTQKKVQDGASLHSDWSCDCKSHGARPHSYRPNLGPLEGKTLCVLPREAG